MLLKRHGEQKFVEAFKIGLRARVHPNQVGIALLLAAFFLLLFNDQFVTAWSAVPFGLTCIFLAIMMKSSGQTSQDYQILKSLL